MNDERAEKLFVGMSNESLGVLAPRVKEMFQ